MGHARAANGYAGRKQSGYVKVIREKRLALSYCSFVVETYGAFGKDAWYVIDSLCHPSTHPLFEGDFNAWKEAMFVCCSAAPRVELATVVVVHTLAGYPYLEPRG